MDTRNRTARNLHEALAAVGARGSVRERDGKWYIQLLKGTHSKRNAAPESGEEDEWLASLVDRLEESSGVRPEVFLASSGHGK